MARKKTILVVDDEDTLAETIHDVLETKGFQVVTAMNGVAALKILTERSVDLIVLDLNMPRMDGYMFMEHLSKRFAQETPRQEPPKIMVLTAVDKKTDMGLAKNLGASEFMSKPFNIDEFIAAVKNLLK